jgi:hypothetical protein
MIAALLGYSFLALAIFYSQNLAFFPQMHLRLLALLLFYLGLRPSLALPLALAVAVGVLQDSFATTPFGLRRRTGLGADGSSRRGNSVYRGPGAFDVFTGARPGKISGPLRLAPPEPARVLAACGVKAGRLSPWPPQG